MLGIVGPLFPAVNPTNAYGSGFSAGSLDIRGRWAPIAGVTVVMSAGLAAGTILLLNAAAAKVYEQRIGALQVVEPSVSGVQVGYAGYFDPSSSKPPASSRSPRRHEFPTTVATEPAGRSATATRSDTPATPKPHEVRVRPGRPQRRRSQRLHRRPPRRRRNGSSKRRRPARTGPASWTAPDVGCGTARDGGLV